MFWLLLEELLLEQQSMAAVSGMAGCVSRLDAPGYGPVEPDARFEVFFILSRFDSEAVLRRIGCGGGTAVGTNLRLVIEASFLFFCNTNS